MRRGLYNVKQVRKRKKKCSILARKFYIIVSPANRSPLPTSQRPASNVLGMLSNAKFEADIDIDEGATHFQLIEESVMNDYQNQLKVTYQPQGKKKHSHTHKEQRNWFQIYVEVWETHVLQLRLDEGIKRSVVG